MKFDVFFNDGVCETVIAKSVAEAKKLAKHKSFNQGYTPDGRKLKIVDVIPSLKSA